MVPAVPSSTTCFAPVVSVLSFSVTFGFRLMVVVCTPALSVVSSA